MSRPRAFFRRLLVDEASAMLVSFRSAVFSSSSVSSKIEPTSVWFSRLAQTRIVP